MLSRITLSVCLFAIAASGQALAAVKRTHPSTKPAPAATKPAPKPTAPERDPALALMACPQTAKGSQAAPRTPAKTAGPATAKASPRTATKADPSVCGYTQTHALHTFPDACQAQAAGAMVLHAGACNGAFCPQSCVADHGVVARRVANGQIKPYDNVCWAEKDHAVYLRAGKCTWQQQGR
jgi:hypothetical protein